MFFIDDLCQILGMFSLNSIGCNKVRSCWHSGGKYNRQMYVRPTCSNLHTERFEVIFQLLDEEQAHGATMNKEQSADDPSMDRFV